jgi:hypothetical protein
MAAMSDEKIVPIRPSVGADVGSTEPNVEVIETLTRMLSEAMSGKLRAIAWVCVDDLGWQRYSWAGSCKISSIITGVARLQHRIMTEDYNNDE